METKGGFLISRIHQVQARVFARMLRESGIEAFNGPQGRILYVLWTQEPLTITEIGRQTSLAKTTLTSMLERMETSGLITRTPDPTNRRQILIALTDKARAYQTVYDDVSQQMNHLFYQGFTDARREAFEAALTDILTTLQQEEANGQSNQNRNHPPDGNDR